MLFAEVFSGASQAWFINGWGLLVTLPLYLFHVLFFLWIALKQNKISLSQLYFLGIVFALYESWITKVLWAGYMDSTGPGFGSVLGVGIGEFSILTFIWHPIMSFIIPILVFEILTGKVHESHFNLLKKSKKKTTLIIIMLILLSSFIANGNGFNIISANSAFIGTMALIAGLYFLSKEADLKTFEFGRKSFIGICIYLGLLYVVTFLFLLPERIPTDIASYTAIIAFYMIAIFLFVNSKPSKFKFNNLEKDQYGIKELLIFSGITLVAINITSSLQTLGYPMMIVTYVGLTIFGAILFPVVAYKSFRVNFK